MIYQSPWSWQGFRGHNRLQGLQQESKYLRTLSLLLIASCEKRNHKDGTDAGLKQQQNTFIHACVFIQIYRPLQHLPASIVVLTWPTRLVHIRLSNASKQRNTTKSMFLLASFNLIIYILKNYPNNVLGMTCIWEKLKQVSCVNDQYFTI